MKRPFSHHYSIPREVFKSEMYPMDWEYFLSLFGAKNLGTGELTKCHGVLLLVLWQISKFELSTNSWNPSPYTRPTANLSICIFAKYFLHTLLALPRALIVMMRHYISARQPLFEILTPQRHIATALDPNQMINATQGNLEQLTQCTCST